MKNKPIRHKETNTFKFKRFADRISEIDVDVFHRVAHWNEVHSDDEESLESEFYKTLQKWNTLNLTEGYTNLKKEVRHVVTLPQLLHHEEEVIEALMKCIEKKDVAFLQPVLELVVAVAKDLQQHFDKHFPSFLKLIINLLDMKDPDILEYAFTTLAHLFKILWRYFIKHIDTTFELLLPLLVDEKPEYVRNFAAESFAFVARKVRDRKSFFQLILDALAVTPHGTTGCGRLLFEVISGTTKQFHSCAEQMLNLYLTALVNDSINEELAFNVLQQIFICIMNEISARHSKVFWDVVLETLDRNLTNADVNNMNDRMIKNLMHLIRLVVDHRGGKMLLDPVSLTSRIVKAIPIYQSKDDILKQIIDLSVSILLADEVKLTQETSYKLTFELTGIESRENLIYVIERLINHPSFETTILPRVMQASILKDKFEEKELQLFSKIILTRAPPALSGDGLHDNWRKINLDFRKFPQESMNFIQNILSTWDNQNRKNCIAENVVKTIIILPHVNPLTEELIEALKNFFTSLHHKLFNEDEENLCTLEEEEILSFAILLAFKTVIHVLDVKSFKELMDMSHVDLAKLMKKYSHSLHMINLVDLFLTHMSCSEYSKDYITDDVFFMVHNFLGQKLTCPDRRFRLTVCHIYSLFNNVKEALIDKDSQGPHAMELLFKAEMVKKSVNIDRDRLIYLRPLEFTSQAVSNLHPKYYDFPLRFLLGNLYINFSPLWTTVSKIIVTFAKEKCEQFWNVFLNELKKDNRQLQVLHRPNEVFYVEHSEEYFNCDVLHPWLEKLAMEDKPDYENYKILLWKCMGEFAGYFEMKNRDLTGHFIDFVDNHFFRGNSETSKSFSIKKNSDENAKIEEIQEEDNEEEEDIEESQGQDDKKTFVKKSALKKTGKPLTFKLLLAQLQFFSKVQNPKTLYREPEMNRIYMELLTSKSTDLQKSALDCIFAYKNKHLKSYKDRLYNLIDEKNLRNELARFKIANDEGTNEILQAEDREVLMPILMRLLYAKMITRGSGRASGGDGALVRRKIILRFLMGIKEEEMMLFARMAFKLFEKYGISFCPEDPLPDLSVLTTNIVKDLDLTNIIPPKRLRSAVNLLAIVIEEFGAKMSQNLLPRLLAILISILAQVKGILDRSSLVHPGFLSTIKELRTTCIGILARFFCHFENYNWSNAELDALFNVGVFPWLEKLPIEGIHSPTTLLKLISAWCQNPRYFCLLVKHQEDNKSITCLPYVMKLLLAKKIHSSVVKSILEMLEKLLTLKDYETELEMQMDVDDCVAGVPLQPTNILQVNPQAVLPGFILNYGSAILSPHVPDILAFIKQKFERSKMGINKTETTILARISELNLDPETSNKLIALSLPILVKRASRGESEEIILELLTTIVNFMKIMNNPEIHMRSILPLLLSVTSTNGRKILMNLLATITSKTPDTSPIPKDILMKNVSVLMSLNAMDQRWVDQADFEKRINAFSEINALATSEDNNQASSQLTIEFGVAILYNCFYFLRYENDMALRDSAGHCLNILGPKLAKMYRGNTNDRNYLIEDTILNLIRYGIKSKNETEKFSSISFLGVMAMECSDVHPVLRDLCLLTNKIDREVDVFENLRHPQLHRKSRALLKFCALAKEWKKAPNPKTLTQFIFPLASFYLCNESFASTNHLVDAAIETVGTVCRLLPWHQYALILKYYLDKLRLSGEFQRQVIRVVVSILDAFHYDLSKTITSKQILPEVKEVTPTEDDREKVTEVDTEELLDVELAKETEEEEEDKGPEVEEEKSQNQAEEFIMKKQTVLSQYAAHRVVLEIKKHHLFKLNRAILASTQNELSHKSNQKRTRSETEEEELMRVPIAIALVKLIQKLPEDILDSNLPGIFMKLCTFLKSRLISVRKSSRETLEAIMLTLGPNYLHFLLREMNSLLTKGFQIHVLAFTIHGVLDKLQPHLKPNHISENLQSILQVCKVDLFGLSAEEKEIGAITRGVSEAKSTKSFNIFKILSKFIDQSCLLDLIQPLSDVLKNTKSHKTLTKVTQCLKNVIDGLADNSFIPNDKLLIFLYGVLSKTIPGLSFKSKPQKNEDKSLKNPHIQKADCFIIPPEPKSRMGVKAVVSKTTGNTNDHVMIEFGLKLFHVLLKREKMVADTLKPYLEPFVPILADCVKSQHVKLNSPALQCLNWVLKMDMKSVHSNLKNICASIFEILHKYGSAGLAKGDNFDLVMAAFKTMSVLVRDVKHFEMTHDQMILLISYVDQDLDNSERQDTAFKLIKAIIGRKFIAKEIHDVMKKVVELSVTSESDNVRQQCRAVFYHFLMDYPLGKELDKYLSLYLAQLKYETQLGRLSALKMMYSIIMGFPEELLIKQSGFFFVMIGVRLVNDDDPTCRKLASNCIQAIITRVPHNQRTNLFDIVVTWLEDQNISHRLLAAHLCGIFPTVEKESFESRLHTLLPLILKQFKVVNDEEDEEPGRYVKRAKKKRRHEAEVEIKDPERLKDHYLFIVLQLTLKISANCRKFLKNDKYIESVKSLAERSQILLAYPHLWVRLAALQQIELILASLDKDKVARLLEKSKTKIEQGEEENEEEVKGFVYTNPVQTLTSLSFDLVSQLYTEMESEQFCHHIVKNLTLIADFVKSLTWKSDKLSETKGNRISMLCLMKTIRKRINMEVTQCPSSISVRKAAFQWMNAVVESNSIAPFLNPILFQMMSPIVRELITTEKSNAPLRQLAKKIATKIRSRIDDEEFARLFCRVQQKLDIKKAERKKLRLQERIIAPVLAAKRKIAKQQKKHRKKRRVM